jgi:hypothetical protein
VDEVVMGCEVFALGGEAAVWHAEYEEDEGFFVLGWVVVVWVFGFGWVGILRGF